MIELTLKVKLTAKQAATLAGIAYWLVVTLLT